VNTALHCLKQARDILEHLGDKKGIASTLFMLGALAYVQDKDAEAISFFNEALEIGQRIGARPIAAIVSLFLALLQGDKGKIAEANSLVAEAKDEIQRMGLESAYQFTTMVMEMIESGNYPT